MIPPSHIASFGARRARDVMQAVPGANYQTIFGSSMDASGTSECVFDLSKYLTSSDLPSAPQQFFDDLFDEPKSRPGVGLLKIKEEPDSTTTSRCSTPESLLPERDYENGDLSSRCQHGANSLARTSFVPQHRSNFPQLQPCISSATTDDDSSDATSDLDIDQKPLPLDPYRLKSALDALGSRLGDASAPNFSPSVLKVEEGDHSPKTQRSKRRKYVEKGTPEYALKRERNNVAVRKSRTKAKLKHIETQMRVGELTEENILLKDRVSALQKELNALKAFISYNNSTFRKPHGTSAYSPALSGLPKSF